MLVSLAWIFLLGSLLAAICARAGLPRIIGLLATGLLLGPYFLGGLDESILGISPDLRQLALIIILLRAGLSLRLADLKSVGRPALLLSFVPACCEICGYVLLAPPLLGVTLPEAALMGSVLAAVSPAVVVPKMVALMEGGWGTGKKIPQMILTGASLDDVFVIVLFTSFTGLVQGGGFSAGALGAIPVSILLGVALGAGAGLFLARFFEWRYRWGKHIRNSGKVILLLGCAFLLVSLEGALKGRVPLSGLLAVMTMAIGLGEWGSTKVSGRLSEKFNKLWLAAELVLFVLVGVAVDLPYALSAGWGVVALIALALVFRTLGVFLSLVATPLNGRERLFCAVAYLPKATVQAAIGSVPLALGLPCGPLILTVAVAAILITAPLGALGIDRLSKGLLEKSEP